MENRAFYHYGIDGIEVSKKNDSIVDIYYGASKSPLHIFKKDVSRFVRAIISSEEAEEAGIEQLPNENEVEFKITLLNRLLKGRAMILATNFKNYSEYYNVGQNGVCEIAGLLIDGNINWAESFPYNELKPEYEDLYPIK